MYDIEDRVVLLCYAKKRLWVIDAGKQIVYDCLVKVAESVGSMRKFMHLLLPDRGIVGNSNNRRKGRLWQNV